MVHFDHRDAAGHDPVRPESFLPSLGFRRRSAADYLFCRVRSGRWLMHGKRVSRASATKALLPATCFGNIKDPPPGP
jgi:hypothetical protein